MSSPIDMEQRTNQHEEQRPSPHKIELALETGRSDNIKEEKASPKLQLIC